MLGFCGIEVEDRIEIGHVFFPTAEVVICAGVDLSTLGFNIVFAFWTLCSASQNTSRTIQTHDGTQTFPFWTICCPEIVLIGLLSSHGELGILEYRRFGILGRRVLSNAAEWGTD